MKDFGALKSIFVPLDLGIEGRFWIVNIAKYGDVLCAHKDVLNSYELATMDKFINPKHKKMYAASHVALHCIIAFYLGVGPKSVPFYFSSMRRPKLLREYSDISLSMSRSLGVVFIAISHHSIIGVDIELKVFFDEYQDLISNFAAPREKKIFSQLLEQKNGFWRWWVAKEAILKVAGTGFSFDPTKVSCDFRRCESIVQSDSLLFNNSKINISSIEIGEKEYTFAIAKKSKN